MPAALERKLKKQASKDPSIKDKDAYVYGTLRKTGWKPSREKKKEKKMADPTPLIVSGAERLEKLEFQYNTSAAGINPTAKLGKAKAGIGNVSNVARAVSQVPRAPGVSGAASLSKTGSAMNTLKKYFNPATAAKMAAYSSREEPQIFDSAEETLEFDTPVAEAVEATKKMGPKVKALLAKAAGISGATIGTASQFGETMKNEINFAGLAGELPAVGSSLERLKGIVGKRVGELSKPLAGEITSPYSRSVLGQNVRAREVGIRGNFMGGAKPPPWKRPGPQYGSPFQKTGIAPQLFTSSSKTIRLAHIGKHLDGVLNFQSDDDRKYGKLALAGGGLAAAGIGGTLAHQAIARTGGYRTFGKQLGAGYGFAKESPGLYGVGSMLKETPKSWAVSPGATVGQLAGKAVGEVKGAGSKVWDVLKSLGGSIKGAFHASALEPDAIRFDDTHILEPWQGVLAKGKIPQEQFPAGISPAMALQFPMPELMRFLKARRPQLLQEQFPGYSSRMGKLIEMGSKLDGIING